MSNLPSPLGAVEKQQETDGLQRLANFSDKWLKPLSLASILFYGLGLVVANSYLVRFGITDFSIFKPECIFTGVWSALFIACAAYPSYCFYGISIKTKDEVFFKRLVKKLFVVIGATLVASMAACLFRLFLGMSQNSQDNLYWYDYWWSIWSYTPPGWATLLIVMNVVVIFFILPPFTTSMPKHDSFRVLVWSLSCFALIGATLVGYEMYPSVSRIFGGGRPESGVTFLFNKDGEALAAKLHSQTNHVPDGGPPGEVEADLIFQTSDFLVLRILYCAPGKRRSELDAIVDKKLVSAYFPPVTAEIFHSPPEFGCK
jgi:hypothetical protein